MNRLRSYEQETIQAKPTDVQLMDAADRLADAIVGHLIEERDFSVHYTECPQIMDELAALIEPKLKAAYRFGWHKARCGGDS
jgi:(p)ppGpp synthase/HD superfamily hydrolase